MADNPNTFVSWTHRIQTHTQTNRRTGHNHAHTRLQDKRLGQKSMNIPKIFPVTVCTDNNNEPRDRFRVVRWNFVGNIELVDYWTFLIQHHRAEYWIFHPFLSLFFPPPFFLFLFFFFYFFNFFFFNFFSSSVSAISERIEKVENKKRKRKGRNKEQGEKKGKEKKEKIN